MRTRRVLLNSALGLGVVAIGVATVTSIGQARTAAPTGQAVPVTRGTLVASVSATGNVDAVKRIQVDLAGSGGTVTKIYVKAGQRVTEGQKLLKVDDSTAKRDLRTAEASLASAEAKLTTTTQGRSSAEASQDNAAIASAQQSVKNAETSLKAARATQSLDSKQQDAVVDDAEDALSSAKHQRDEAQDDLAEAKAQLAKDQAAGDAEAVNTDQSQVSSLTSALSSAESSVGSAESSLSSAKRTRAATELKDSQSVASAKGQLGTANKQLDQQRAAAAVNAQPARPGALEDAQSQIDSAQVDVDKAKQEVAETTLTAPADGTVATINAVVGQSSSTGASSGSSSSSSSAGSSTGGSSGGASGSGSSAGASSGSGSSSGLVVLTDLTQKEISATVAEVDATKLKPGLRAQVAFPASGLTATGTVTRIDTEDTVTNNVVEYGVKVRLDTQDSKVLIGQTATLTIITDQRENVLIVPTSAVRTVDDHPTVTRRTNDRTKTVDAPVTIQTGLVGTTGTEVTSGLAEGDQVVLPTGGGS